MSKSIKISVLLSVCLLACTTLVNAQEVAVTKYFDSNWVAASKDKAFYYTEFARQDTAYQVTSYWTGSGKIRSKGVFADTNFDRQIGSRIIFYESGIVSDSIVAGKKGVTQHYYHYNEIGKLVEHIFYNKPADNMLSEKYDDNGTRLPGTTVYLEMAKFPGGEDGWREYLIKHLRGKTVAKHKAPPGIYTVVVTFLVDTNGKISEVTAANDPGYGSAEEAVRVIKDGPDWIPAIQYGKKVVFRQKQSISFDISEK